MKRFIAMFVVTLAFTGAVVAFVPAAARAQSTSDVLEEGGYRLPRSHQYQTYDQGKGTFVDVDLASIPGRLAASQPVYDRTAGMWVFNPYANVGGKNPMYAAGAAPAAAGTQGAWQRLHGTVVSTSGSTMQFKTDDGRTIAVDMSKIGGSVQQALTANEGATLIGVAGAQPNQFTAQYIQQDSSDPARGGTVAGQTSTTASSSAQATASTTPSDPKSWQRIHGKVGAISGNALTLKTDDGQTVTVDMAQVAAGVRGSLAADEGVTVIGFYRSADKKNVEARFIQKDSSADAASPKTTQ